MGFVQIFLPIYTSLLIYNTYYNTSKLNNKRRHIGKNFLNNYNLTRNKFEW